MIADGSIRIYRKNRGALANYADVNLSAALKMRKEFLLSGLEVKIVIMKDGRWVTISETKGWEP